MRISALDFEAFQYRVYDYPAGCFRKDLVWVDDDVNMVGVGFASQGKEWVFEVEHRKRVLIITALKWVALDLPGEEADTSSKWTRSDAGGWKKIPVEVTYGQDNPDYVVVR